MVMVWALREYVIFLQILIGSLSCPEPIPVHDDNIRSQGLILRSAATDCKVQALYMEWSG